MPIVPHFHLRQDEDFVFVEIQVPYLRINEATTEIHIDQADFTFYCKPYLLKLSFPSTFQDDEHCKAVFDPHAQNGMLTCWLKKTIPGEHFPDLDLLSNLMTPRRVSGAGRLHSSPLIEEIGSDDNLAAAEDNLDLPEHITAEEILPELCISDAHHYGFNRQYSGLFRGSEILAEVFEGREVESVLSNRREERLRREQEDFSVTRYLGDFLGVEEDYVFIEAMKYQAVWDQDTLALTQTETEVLANKLKPKSFLINPNSSHWKYLVLNLVDLVFASSYDFRLTLGEHNVESAGNIARLSVNLSWLESFNAEDSLQTVVVHCLRRSLIYPYIRHWDFSLQVLDDVIRLFEAGKRSVLKLLLYAYLIFDHSEFYYLFNRAFLNDYCVWIQQVPDSKLSEVGAELKVARGKLQKQDLFLNLVEIENAADLMAEEEDENVLGSLQPSFPGGLLHPTSPYVSLVPERLIVTGNEEIAQSTPIISMIDLPIHCEDGATSADPIDDLAVAINTLNLGKDG